MSNFDLKDKIDKQIYRLFNIGSDMKFLLRFELRRLLRSNAIYCNRHSGERCFILGTGPSLAGLTSAQVAALSAECVFAVNSIYKTPVLDSISPKYYTLMDNHYWGIASYTFGEIAKKYRDNMPVFITDIRARCVMPNGVDCIYLYAKNYPIDVVRYDLSGNLSATMNVIGFSILAAIYMGFKEIHLLGCDYTSFCSRVSAHCYDDQDEIDTLPSHNLAFYLKYYHLTTEFHYLIAVLAREKGVKIVNLSKGSLLDAYPCAELEGFLW